MRHIINVVVSADQPDPPGISQNDDENQHETTWFACADQSNPGNFLDAMGNPFLRWLRALRLAHQFYHVVNSTKLWSGKRPLVLVCGHSFANKVAAYAAKWGGGDVVMPASDRKPLGPTRFLVDDDGNLSMLGD